MRTALRKAFRHSTLLPMGQILRLHPHLAIRAERSQQSVNADRAIETKLKRYFDTKLAVVTGELAVVKRELAVVKRELANSRMAGLASAPVTLKAALKTFSVAVVLILMRKQGDPRGTQRTLDHLVKLRVIKRLPPPHFPPISSTTNFDLLSWASFLIAPSQLQQLGTAKYDAHAFHALIADIAAAAKSPGVVMLVGDALLAVRPGPTGFIRQKHSTAAHEVLLDLFLGTARAHQDAGRSLTDPGWRLALDLWALINDTTDVGDDVDDVVKA
ncbi:hypothetical protein B0H16DRAFT_1631579 [Mycena metata]|uniref:Uncharacterized protein n=1 Tax=Mycena metata TaxID=1033252 RepID=A0AAD7H0D9_9AGAR|nr:hypothetical protein B0H16DRAFT_1631579 [Mycena metata]